MYIDNFSCLKVFQLRSNHNTTSDKVYRKNKSNLTLYDGGPCFNDTHWEKLQDSIQEFVKLEFQLLLIIVYTTS